VSSTSLSVKSSCSQPSRVLGTRKRSARYSSTLSPSSTSSAEQLEVTFLTAGFQACPATTSESFATTGCLFVSPPKQRWQNGAPPTFFSHRHVVGHSIFGRALESTSVRAEGSSSVGGRFLQQMCRSLDETASRLRLRRRLLLSGVTVLRRERDCALQPFDEIGFAFVTPGLLSRSLSCQRSLHTQFETSKENDTYKTLPILACSKTAT